MECNNLMGWVLKVDNPALENQVLLDHPTLYLSPESVNLGWIEGTFPLFTVQAGNRFRATLGCSDNHSNCHVGFVLNYRVGIGPVQNRGTWEEVYDGQVIQVDLDLTSLAGNTGYFIIKAYAESVSRQNVAAWVLPNICTKKWLHKTAIEKQE